MESPGQDGGVPIRPRRDRFGPHTRRERKGEGAPAAEEEADGHAGLTKRQCLLSVSRPTGKSPNKLSLRRQAAVRNSSVPTRAAAARGESLVHNMPEKNPSVPGQHDGKAGSATEHDLQLGCFFSALSPLLPPPSPLSPPHVFDCLQDIKCPSALSCLGFPSFS